MNRRTHQALATLLRERLSCLDTDTDSLRNSAIDFWYPKCDPDRKTDPEVVEAYENLNRIKNRLRTLRRQRTKWLAIQREVLAPLKVSKKTSNFIEP